ncbi:MAG: anthranilate synthase component I [Thermodesulfobacteriota bacterium]
MKKGRYYPSLEDFRVLSRTYNVVPVYREILADTETPVSAFMKIDHGGDAFLLESVEGGDKWGRYSFLGVDPRMVLRAKGDEVEVLGPHGEVKKEKGPLEVLRKISAKFRAAPVAGGPRFLGGAIGYIGYDVVRHIEKLPQIAEDDLGLDDMYLIFTDTLLVFDNVEHKIKVVSNAFVEEGADVAALYNDCLARIEGLVEALRTGAAESRNNTPAASHTTEEESHGVISSNFRREDFLKAVETIKEYIRSGDVIQAVLSQRFSTSLPARPFDIYRALRVVNPSPYMFFLRLGDLHLVGSSPEILVRVEDGDVNVKPIAGTRKRGRDEAEDLQLEKDLLSDPKELAEHIMLVDLGRNDIGRVSESGTVQVSDLMNVERYSHVMHIVTDVHGRLGDGSDALDAFSACFPAGTLSGAPKIRAMEIIDELEPCRRGVYGGSVGYLGYGGNLDMCIAIRTMIIKDGKVYVQAGAGIVADSHPEKEFEETENKARGLLKAIEMARDLFL